MKLINLTPHEIVLRLAGADLRIEPSDTQCRVRTSALYEGDLDVDGQAVPVWRTVYGGVTGLPDPAADTRYLVSAVVLAALAGSREDVLAPDTGPESAIRDAEGWLVAVRRLTR